MGPQPDQGHGPVSGKPAGFPEVPGKLTGEVAKAKASESHGNGHGQPPGHEGKHVSGKQHIHKGK